MIPEYKISLFNKNKKIIKKVENIETVENNFIKQNYNRKNFNNKKFNKNFSGSSRYKKKFKYNPKVKKNNFNQTKKIAN